MRSSIACPLCHKNMVYAGSKPGFARDSNKQLIAVIRRIYMCTSDPDACGNIVAFLYRTDGKEGDLHVQLEEERLGIRKKRVTHIEGVND